VIGTVSQTSKSRCLYCSLICPIGLEAKSLGIVAPCYESGSTHISEGRLCYRGHYVAALMAHPKRLAAAFSRGRAGANLEKYGDLLSKAATEIRGASSQGGLGVMMSANMSCEQIAAVTRFFKSSVPAKHISVFAPPVDTALLSGVAVSGAPLAALEDIKTAECVLAIGDVLGTHRVLARELLDVPGRSRKAEFINIDTIEGCTARFASTRLSVRADGELNAVLGMALSAGMKADEALNEDRGADELLSAAGVDSSAALQCIDSLRADPNSLVLVTVPSGRCSRADIMGIAAGRLAVQTESKLLPLYTYGNSPGAYALSHALGMTPMTRWFEAACAGEFSCVLLVDADMLGIVPDAFTSKALKDVNCIIAASPMPNATTTRADISLPVSFWFETGGKVLDHQGRAFDLEPLKNGDPVTVSASELIGKFATEMGVSAPEADELDLEEIWKEANAAARIPKSDISPAGGDEADSFTLVSRTENLDLYESGLSKKLDWVATIEPQAILLLNPADASSLGIRDSDVVTVNGGVSGRADLCARLSATVNRGTIAVSASGSEVKNLFDWEIINGFIQTGPAKVTLDAVRAKE